MTADGSTRGVLPAALVLFGIMAAHALLETARDALFLVKLGPERLAWAYLAIAGAALVALWALRRATGSLHAPRGPRRLLVGLVGTGALGTGVLALALPYAPVLVFVLYVWSGLVATLVVPTFWAVVDRGVHVGVAKRTFALIGAGGVLGALAGSTAAGVLARVVDARALVWVAAGVLATTALAAAVIAPVAVRPVPRVRAGRADRMHVQRRTRRYARLLLALGLCSTIALTLGDLMFKRFLAEHYAGEQLATMFGTIYAGLNLLGLVVQLGVTSRLLDRVGVGGALVVLPAIALASALGFVLTGGALAIIAFKLGDGGLRHSVHRVASEILFLPLSPGVRDTGKPVDRGDRPARRPDDRARSRHSSSRPVTMRCSRSRCSRRSRRRPGSWRSR